MNFGGFFVEPILCQALAGAVTQTHHWAWATKFLPWASSQVPVAFAKDRMEFCVLPVGSSCSDPLVALQPVLNISGYPKLPVVT